MIEIYTCITAGYDDLKKPPIFRNVRYTAFVEGVTLPKPPWSLQPVKGDASPDPTRRSRQMKAQAHRSFPNAEYSLWVDGCFRIEQSLEKALPRWLDLLKDHDLVTFAHQEHDCTYQHATRVIDVGLDAEGVVSKQMARYRQGGLPDHAGMVQTNVILRKHTGATEYFNDLWWEEIMHGSRRDQLSFMWAARKAKLRYVALGPEERQHFRGMSHRGSRMKVT